jgi:hypothetical protein
MTSIPDAAEIADLRPDTLKKYCCGYSDLVRGIDFVVRRFAPYRKRIYFTKRGIFRLQSRSYRTFLHGNGSSSAIASFRHPGLQPVYRGSSEVELRQRARQRLALVMQQYPEHPCAVPSCLCIIHRLGLTQADDKDWALLRRPPK